MCWLRLWAARLPLTENATCFKTADCPRKVANLCVCLSTQLSVSVWLCLCVCFISCVCICICDSLCLLNIWWCQCECRFRWSVGVFLCAIFQKKSKWCIEICCKAPWAYPKCIEIQWPHLPVSVSSTSGAHIWKSSKGLLLEAASATNEFVYSFEFWNDIFCGVWHL